MGKFIEYTLHNTEPVRIADDSTSQKGQALTLKYIPGSAVRGIIINALSKEKNFSDIKASLFRETRYLNAYPCVVKDGKRQELIPSPMGFYEDKVQKEIKKVENVVVSDDNFVSGHKRASLGQFCLFDDDTIETYTVAADSDMKILRNVDEDKDRNVFRNEYIVPGYTFLGYVYAPSDEMAEMVMKTLSGTVYVGNARADGYGRCEVSSRVAENLPYSDIGADTAKGECYMMLLSDMCMRSETGEYCGINLTVLEQLLGVTDLKIKLCSTSTRTVRGYNRTLGSRIPSINMYRMGSVFHLTFNGTITRDRIRQVTESGIGVRTDEGFGQIIFLSNYEKIDRKKAGVDSLVSDDSSADTHEEDRQMVSAIAKVVYLNRIKTASMKYVIDEVEVDNNQDSFKWNNITSSQRGVLGTFTTAYRYDPEKAIDTLSRYYAHAGEKEANLRVHKAGTKADKVWKDLKTSILDRDINDILSIRTESVMGIDVSELLTDEEVLRIKLDLITEILKFANKNDSGEAVQ